MIEALGLCKSYNGTPAVTDISFTIEPGSVVGFLGPNGAGKSTTMKMLAGVLLPDRGTASLCGRDIVSQTNAAQANLGYMPEAASGFSDLTVWEFLAYCAQARGFGRHEREVAISTICEQTFLMPARNDIIGTLSKGWRQRAWFAQAVLHGPAALVLDEPTDGLDPGQKRHVRDYIRKISERTAIIFSTHILEEAEELCDRVVIIADGRVRADEPTSALVDKSGRLAPAFAELTAAASAPTS